MVSPYHEAEEGNQNGGEHHRAVPEQALTSKCRNNIGNDTKCRKDKYVNLRVSEDPEYMLPENRVTAIADFKEVSSEYPVKA
ncbi:hypothetical protein D3C81_1292070 [compost metagenome]